MAQDRPVSEVVARIRRRDNLTQEALARLLGVSFSTVNAWESGRSEPQARHRRRLEQLAAAREAPDADRASILCVDDSPFDLENLTSLVRDAAEVLGVEVEVVAERDAMGALIALGRVRPKVAFLDVVMPGLDGVELADRLAELPELSDSTLVLVTMRQDEQVELAAAERGLELLYKPLTIGMVGAALRRAGLLAPPDATP
ncbi:MAG: response regulator [Nitriliruptoraceae bacterium]